MCVLLFVCNTTYSNKLLKVIHEYCLIDADGSEAKVFIFMFWTMHNNQVEYQLRLCLCPFVFFTRFHLCVCKNVHYLLCMYCSTITVLFIFINSLALSSYWYPLVSLTQMWKTKT